MSDLKNNTDWLNSPPEIEINDEYRKAIGAAVRGESMFITGKAGTGKTVLLKLLYATLKERGQQVAIAAPTGVAAKNAGGVTIHSLLHLPIGPFLPGHKKQGLYSLAKANVEVIKVIDTLIIDEISMVRCDLLDEVDDVLRHYRDSEAPFGGVQLILIGDLYQLIPVAEKDEWDILKGTYRDPYFFNSKALEQIKYRLIELNKVYRQEDDEFIKALNRIRLGYCLDIDQALFNTRYQPAFTDRNSEYVWLTTHNYLAKKRNSEKLDQLNTKEFVFQASIHGFFPREDEPTSYYLKLKEGARVMFIKNDNTRGFVNGMMGTVIKIYSDSVVVQPDDNVPPITVERAKWDCEQYKVNKQTKEIEIEVCGSFIQLPLKLAWSITIHKSQGLTFDKAAIDLKKSFAEGQAYVALSRCRSLGGIVMISKLESKYTHTDPAIARYLSKKK